MPWMPNAAEVDRGFAKLIRLNRENPMQGFAVGKSSEKYGPYLVDGRTHRLVSSKARRSGSIGRGRLKGLQRYLDLSDEEFKELCQCSMSGPEYHALTIQKLRITNDAP